MVACASRSRKVKAHLPNRSALSTKSRSVRRSGARFMRLFQTSERHLAQAVGTLKCTPIISFSLTRPLLLYE